LVKHYSFRSFLMMTKRTCLRRIHRAVHGRGKKEDRKEKKEKIKKKKKEKEERKRRKK
jgi:hypothetical protein